ncbi:ABC transporter permease [Nocardia farcinica]|uniref:ABC transporter permease n=1 Tax=Nocardia farcinica TaxID=37329 RepID=UPI000BF145B7|nr:ABC transporter permease [Nocardia farcinica]PEH77156.1 ABC transporter permease [Nocardia sp. FDAARGOS_372]MBF6185200.1 ABC transporter permease [Nocardia farcinica]MBF6253301.1 ABC transporter permease [Nocardia farcinica]MBF6261604.1 ABC transporter permease [Nocardia farcinica]MBF6280143.1 ABC transporter permease [Nocardia farcinica]
MTLQLDPVATAPPPTAVPVPTPATTAPLPAAWRRATGLARKSAGLVLVLILWQLGARGWLGATTPAPTEVVAAGWDLISSGELWRHLAASARRVGTGLALGIGIGLVLGVAAGLFRLAEDLVNAPVQALRMMPALALLPVFIIWFGIGDSFKIALIAVAPVFPIYLNVFAGIRSVDRRLVEAGESLGLNRFELTTRIILPGALPQIFVGLRQALGIGWLALVVAEMQTTPVGLGFLMNDAKEFLRTDQIFLVLVVYALLGLLSDLLVRLLERRFLAWRTGFEGQ